MTLNLRTAICAVAFAATLLSLLPAQAQTVSPQDTLNQYVTDLQKNPNDSDLREKIIRFAQTMNPPPPVPEDAERYMARGVAAVKGAKDANDFKEAAAELEKATLAAPWLANTYYNLGVAQDKAGLYDAAIKNLKLYLLAAPDATDARQVKNLIYEVEYRRDKAAKESSPQAVAVRRQKEYEVWLRNLNGARYVGQSRLMDGIIWDNELVIMGNRLVWRQRIAWISPNTVVDDRRVGEWYELTSMQIVGRTAESNGRPAKFTIGEDGTSITVGPPYLGTFTFYRQ
jgi:tetratricopeptide (TPR) repeat protein